MQAIEWNDAELKIGHAEIDAQHRRMVDIFNELHAWAYAGDQGPAKKRLLDELLHLAGENFRAEEALMSAHPQYADRYRWHCGVHRRLLLELRALRGGLLRRNGGVNLKTLNFLRNWVFNHMAHADRELAELPACAVVPT